MLNTQISGIVTELTSQAGVNAYIVCSISIRLGIVRALKYAKSTIVIGISGQASLSAFVGRILHVVSMGAHLYTTFCGRVRKSEPIRCVLAHVPADSSHVVGKPTMIHAGFHASSRIILPIGIDSAGAYLHTQSV